MIVYLQIRKCKGGGGFFSITNCIAFTLFRNTIMNMYKMLNTFD